MLKKYLIQLVIFILVVVLCDLLIHSMLSNAFRKTETGETGGFVNKIRKVKAEVVILGDSRGKYHYDPRIFKEVLKMSVYNAGGNGQGMPYIRGLTDLLLHDYTPILFIVNVDASTLVFFQEKYDSVTILAPFMDESEAIRRIIYNRSIFEPFKYLFKSFRYNSKPFAILKNYHVKDSTIDGFEITERRFNPTQLAEEEKSNDQRVWTIDPYLEELLHETINQVKSAGALIVLVNSPRWRSRLQNRPSPETHFPFFRRVNQKRKHSVSLYHPGKHCCIS